MSSINITVKALDMASGPLKKIGTSMVGLRTAMMGLAAIGGIGYMGKEIIEASSNLEQMNVRLKALLGTAESGQAATRWIINFAEKNPLKTIKEMEEMFKSLVTAGIKPTTEAMQGLLGATVKYGLSGQDLGRLTKALRQIGAMTNTQKQEMNQLSEQIPLFMRELASAMGRSQAQLLEDIKNRKVDSAETLNNVMMIISKGSAEAIADFNKTWEGGLARLSIAWTKLLQQLGSTGFFDDMKSGLDRVTDFVKDRTELIKGLFKTTWTYVKDQFVAILGDALSSDVFMDNFQAMSILFVRISGISTVFLGTIKDMGVIATNIVGKLANAVKDLSDYGARIKHNMTFSTDDAIKQRVEDLKGLIQKQEQLMSAPRGRDGTRTSNEQWLAQQKKLLAELKEEFIDLQSITDGKDRFKTEDFSSLMINFISSVNERNEASGAAADKAIASLKDVFADDKRRTAINKMFEDALNAGQADTDETLIGKQFQENIDKLTVDQPKNFSTGWKKALEDIKEKSKETFGEMADLGEYMAKNITDALSSGFETLFQQLKEGVLDVKSIMMSVLDEIYKAMARILAQRMAVGIVTQVGHAFLSGSGTVENSPFLVDGSNAVQGPVQANGSFKPTMTSSQGMQKVEIINNSGEQLQVTQARSKNENGDTIMSIVLDSINRNKNGSRTMLKAMMA